MLKDFQHQDTYGCQVERRRRLANICQLEWRHYVEQIQLANFVFTFAAVISVGVVIGFILQS